jgi:uncharacterized protein
MGRLLFILVLLAVSFYGVKYVRDKLDKPSTKPKKVSKSTNNNKMVKCLHCGLHIPEKEAIQQGEKVFCSLEHAKREL